MRTKIKRSTFIAFSLLGPLLLTMAPDSVSGQTPSSGVAKPAESRLLDGALDPSAWIVPDKEGEVQASDKTTPDGGQALLFRVPVDYSSGQAEYPVGWPRMGLALKGENANWSGWSAFELMVMARTSRPDNAKLVVTVLIGNRPSQLVRNIVLPAQGEWMSVKVPIDEIKAAGVDVGSVPEIRVSVAESDYADKETVNLTLGGFRLIR
jgi:hypothetical protein